MNKTIVTCDLTDQKCPLTLIRTVGVLDTMLPGESVDILVKGEEPVRDMVPNLKSEGHKVLSVMDEGREVHRIRIRRGVIQD